MEEWFGVQGGRQFTRSWEKLKVFGKGVFAGPLRARDTERSSPHHVWPSHSLETSFVTALFWNKPFLIIIFLTFF